MQAGIGNVITGSLFATAQSIAMGGAVPAAVTAAGAGITGMTAAAAANYGSSILSAVSAGLGAAANLTRQG